MGATNNRVKKVLVSNSVAVNTGTTIATAVNNDVLLVNRAGTVVSDTGTLISDINNDVVRVALGTSSTAGVVKYSSPIQVRNVRKVTTQLYEVPVQHSIKIVGANAVPTTSAAGTNFNIKLQFHDTNRVMQDKYGSQFFSYTSIDADEDAATIFTALAAKINAVVFNKQVTASVSGSDLIITGIAIPNTSINIYQYRYFDVFLRSGFSTSIETFTITTATPTPASTDDIVITPGKPGRGLGQQVRDMELEGMYDFNRTQFPVHTDTRRAIADTGYYNLVTIEHDTAKLSALHSTYYAPETTIIAFFAAEGTATTPFDGAGTPIASAKQAAFMTKLTSLIESADVFVA